MNHMLNSPGSQFLVAPMLRVGTRFIWSAQTRLRFEQAATRTPLECGLRVLLGLQPLSVNSTRSLLRSGLPAFGTTTAYPLRVCTTPQMRRRVCALHINPGKQSGLGMIEVLVTLVILMVGLLGLAGLQMQGLRSEMESYQRVQALILLQDMVGRINANRANAANYVVVGNMGTGDGNTVVCTTLAAGKDRDICEWSDALKGAGEKSGTTSVGAMIGGRGCITQPSANTYLISVVWQGMGETFANITNLCGQNQYDNEAQRRVVSLTIRIGNLTAL